jgi:uncharacterized OsmC-like protein
MHRETIHFENAAGVRLAGVLDRISDRPPRGYVLFAHGFTGGQDIQAAAISQALCSQHVGVLRFDVTGPGEGELRGAALSSAVADVVAAARFLDRDHAAPVILMGHAAAGAVMLHAAHEIPSARALAAIDGLVDARLQETVRALGRGLLILHAPMDSAIASDAVLAAWAASYLDTPAEETGMDHEELVVARIGARGLRTDMRAGGLPLIADEPRGLGGTAAGPTPYGYLGAALASCTAMTLRMYANHKKIDLGGVEVRVYHDKVHAEDCKHCETRKGKIDRFRRELRLEGELDDAQRRRLVEIADRCPVHRTLQAEVDIETTLVDD